MSAVFESCRRLFDRDSARQTEYPWDDWQCTFYFHFPDGPLVERLAGVSDPGVTGFALALCEWVCARLWTYSDVREPLEFINAAWVKVLGAGDCRRVEFAPEEWPGPVRGPLCYAQLIVADTVFDAPEDREVIARACWACNLARHVIDGPPLATFEEWVASTCQRLEKFHPFEILRPSSIFDDHYPTPRPVPPPAFCHRAPYDPLLSDKYISDHRFGLLPSNRYLNTTRR